MSDVIHPWVGKTKWEMFQDESYYHMWCVRPENGTEWGACFYVPSMQEAQGLKELLESSGAENQRLSELVALQQNQIKSNSETIKIMRKALLTAINALEFLEDFDHWDEEMGQTPTARPAIELGQEALNHNKEITSENEHRVD